MAGQLPRSSPGTGSVWTQLMDDLTGRVAARSCPRGARVVRVPRPGAQRKWEDSSWHGTELGTAAKERSRSGSGRKRRRWRVRAAASTDPLQACPREPGCWARSAPLCWTRSPCHLPGRGSWGRGSFLSPRLRAVLSHGSWETEEGACSVGVLWAPLGWPHRGQSKPGSQGYQFLVWSLPGSPKLNHSLPQGWGSSSYLGRESSREIRDAKRIPRL